jgi:NAD+ diphosphatase
VNAEKLVDFSALRVNLGQSSPPVCGEVTLNFLFHRPYPSNLMVGCFGQARDDQRIDLTLDNELDDARWFSRSDVQDVLAHPDGTNIRREEHKKFEADQQTNAGQDETSAALAPSEGAVAGTEAAVTDGKRVKDQSEGGLRFRVPPTTAIAGQLIKLWADGGLEATGGLQKGRL